jgi:hypothetical protein
VLGCLVFVVLAALAFILAVFGVAASALEALFWPVAVAFFAACFYALWLKARWKRLHMTGTTEEKVKNWVWLHKPGQAVQGWYYVTWLNEAGNSEKLKEYEEWRRAEYKKLQDAKKQ